MVLVAGVGRDGKRIQLVMCCLFFCLSFISLYLPLRGSVVLITLNIQIIPSGVIESSCFPSCGSFDVFPVYHRKGRQGGWWRGHQRGNEAE